MPTIDDDLDYDLEAELKALEEDTDYLDGSFGSITEFPDL